jgi:hypothetical protein
MEMQKKYFIVMLFVIIVTLSIAAPGQSQADDSLYVSSDGTVSIGTTDLDGTPAKGRLTVKGTTTDGTTNIIVGRNSSEANVFSVNTSGQITGSVLSTSEYLTNDTSETQMSSIMLPTTSSSNTSSHIGGAHYIRPLINTGVTQSGYEMGLYTQVLRNCYNSSAIENGTLAALYGQQILYGHNSTNTAATPLTTNAYGLYLYPYYKTGTITNMYDLYIGTGVSGGTVTNRYAIYQQASAAKNYFAGNIGIGRNPSYPIHASSGAYLSTAGVWTDASSREYKENIRDLTEEDAMAVLKDLKPSRFNYKADASDEYLGFIAEDVPDLVATEGRKGLSPMDIVAVLTKVVQKQQQEIDELKNLLIEKNK